MQDVPLNVIDVLRFAAVAHGKREIVSRNVDEPTWRYNYREAFARTSLAAKALSKLGVNRGDRVASLAWNTHRHFELFYAVPGVGAILQTANPRLPEDHLVFVLDHGGARVLLFERNMLDLVERIRPRLTTVEVYIVLADEKRTPSGWTSYETILAAEAGEFDWPKLPETDAAFLCYTSGTTGEPKGVIYTHRSVVLHAMAAGLNGALGFSAFDVIMPCQSLYHATAWGLPFAGPMNGAKLVFPADRFDGASLQALIKEEGVTFTGGVPTIWTMYLDYIMHAGETPGQLSRIVIGGSAVPRAMAESFASLGVAVRQIWGLTETSPLGVVSTPIPATTALGSEGENEIIWARQGRLMFGFEMKIVDDEGRSLPFDGKSSGTVMARGPWVVDRYYRQDTSVLDPDGWFDTGDIATVDENAFLRITDRSKDVIKSGGEWISSIDLENIAAAFPGVKIAAVVGVYHPKWEERPILLIESHSGMTVREDDVRDFLTQKVPRWWLPDRILLGPVPLTATGKIDKKTIKSRYAAILN